MKKTQQSDCKGCDVRTAWKSSTPSNSSKDRQRRLLERAKYLKPVLDTSKL